MNEQLQGALTSLINKSLDGLDTATDILTAELPEVIAQLLLWYGVSSFIYSVIGLCLMAFSIWIAKETSSRFKKAEKGSYLKDYDEGINVGVVINGFVSVGVSMVGIIMFNLTWLKIWIAPKIWLIEYAASLAK